MNALKCRSMASLFFIGHIPNTKLVEDSGRTGQAQPDQSGYADANIPSRHICLWRLPAGRCTSDGQFSGDGATAAISAIKYVDEMKIEDEQALKTLLKRLPDHCYNRVSL